MNSRVSKTLKDRKVRRLLISLSASPEILMPSDSRLKEISRYRTRVHHKQIQDAIFQANATTLHVFLSRKTLSFHLIIKIRSQLVLMARVCLVFLFVVRWGLFVCYLFFVFLKKFF